MAVRVSTPPEGVNTWRMTSMPAGGCPLAERFTTLPLSWVGSWALAMGRRSRAAVVKANRKGRERRRGFMGIRRCRCGG